MIVQDESRGHGNPPQRWATPPNHQYDSRWLRVERREGYDWRAHLYNQFGQLQNEFNWNTVWKCDYVYLNGRLLAKVVDYQGGGSTSAMGEGGGTTEDIGDPPPPPPGIPPVKIYWYHLDHLGTPWFMTDIGRNHRWDAHYYPFGEVASENVSEPSPHRMPGQYRDDKAGVYYNWHRYYDPSVGRYLQADPIGLDGGINLYAYVHNRPLVFIDPWGLILYSAEETEEIIQEASRKNIFQVFYSFVRNQDYDFKANQPNDKFTVDGVVIGADRFGNYLAGYIGYKFKLGSFLYGYAGARAGGVWYDFKDNVIHGDPKKFDWDADSRYDLMWGASRALIEEILLIEQCDKN